MYIGILCFSESESNEIVFYLSLKFGCRIDTAQQQMALNFELVVSDQFFSVPLVAHTCSKFSAIYYRVVSIRIHKIVPKFKTKNVRTQNNSIWTTQCTIKCISNIILPQLFCYILAWLKIIEAHMYCGYQPVIINLSIITLLFRLEESMHTNSKSHCYVRIF